MHPKLIEFPPTPVVLRVDTDWYDGPVTGFLRAPALEEHLPGVTELVFGPLWRDWWREVDRLYLAAPIPTGSCAALLATDPHAHAARDGSFWVSDEHLPPELAALLAPFETGPAISCPFVIRMKLERSVRVWRRADGHHFDRALIEAALPRDTDT